MFLKKTIKQSITGISRFLDWLIEKSSQFDQWISDGVRREDDDDN